MDLINGLLSFWLPVGSGQMEVPAGDGLERGEGPGSIYPQCSLPATLKGNITPPKATAPIKQPTFMAIAILSNI